MVELSYKKLGGILVLVILLSSGSTYFLEKTGDYVNCRGQWILQDNGQYYCEQKDIIEWCYEIESRGSGWYRCWIGEFMTENNTFLIPIQKQPITYENMEGKVIATGDCIIQGVYCYCNPRGLLSNKVKCEDIGL